MNPGEKSDNETVVITLQNNRKPDQIIYLVMNEANGHFETRGLNGLFGVQEIRLEGDDILPALPEYAQVLSFLFDTMSTAQDLNLPYTYQSEFTFGSKNYTLSEEEDHRVLRSVPGGEGPSLFA